MAHARRSRRAQAQLHQAQANLSYTNIISPIDGDGHLAQRRRRADGRGVALGADALHDRRGPHQDAGGHQRLRGRRRAARRGDDGVLHRRRVSRASASTARSARSATRRRRCRTSSRTTRSSTSTTPTCGCVPGMTANVTVVYADKKRRRSRSRTRRCASGRRRRRTRPKPQRSAATAHRARRAPAARRGRRGTRGKAGPDAPRRADGATTRCAAGREQDRPLDGSYTEIVTGTAPVDRRTPGLTDGAGHRGRRRAATLKEGDVVIVDARWPARRRPRRPRPRRGGRRSDGPGGA